MRMRYVSIIYQFGGASQSLERHYRELRDDLLRHGQHYGFLQAPAAWRPPVDIHETPDAILIKIELAGVREDGIEIALYSNALVVTGRRDDDSDHDETVCYHEAQVRYGPFRAEILLPTPVRQDAVEAVYENGFLRVRLPKATPGEPGRDETNNDSEGQSAGGAGRRLNAAPPFGTIPTGSAARSRAVLSRRAI